MRSPEAGARPTVRDVDAMSKSGTRSSDGIGAALAAGWAWFVVPGQWSGRRTTGEVALAAVLALLGAGTEELLGGEGWRLIWVAAGSAALSLVRRRLPASVLVLTAGLTPFVPGFGPLLLVVGWSSGRYIAGVGRALAAFIAAFVLNVGGVSSGPGTGTGCSPSPSRRPSTTWAPPWLPDSPTATGPSGGPCCTRSRSATPSCCGSGPWWSGRPG